jgi:hypothetical protein
LIAFFFGENNDSIAVFTPFPADFVEEDDFIVVPSTLFPESSYIIPPPNPPEIYDNYMPVLPGMETSVVQAQETEMNPIQIQDGN